MPLLPDLDNVMAQMLPEQMNGCAAGHFAVHNLRPCWASDMKRHIAHRPIISMSFEYIVALQKITANRGLLEGSERNFQWPAKAS